MPLIPPDGRTPAAKRYAPRTLAEHPSANPPLNLTFFDFSKQTKEYQIQPTRVAQGGMARVYICPVPVAMNTDGVIAVKKLRENTWDSRSLEVVRQEAQLWSALGSSPNIVTLHDVQWDGTMFIEYVDYSIRDILQMKRPRTYTMLVQTMLHVVLGLQHARSTLPGFSHGDLKPENIMVADDQVCKLTDFGFARAVQQQFLNHRRGGTRPYMAPEIRNAAIGSPQGDIFSLGCVMYEFLTGQLPPAGHRSRLTALRSLHGDSLFTRNLLDVTLSCLDSEPTARPSLSELQIASLELSTRFNLKVRIPQPVHPTSDQQIDQIHHLTELDLVDMAEYRIRPLLHQESESSVHELKMLVVAARIFSSRQEWWIDADHILQRAEQLVADVPSVMKAAYHAARGHLADKRGKPLALEAYQQAVALAPEIPSYRESLARLYAANGRPAEAADTMASILNNRSGILQFDTAVAYALAAGDFAQALRFADLGVRRDPLSPIARGLRCLALMRRGRQLSMEEFAQYVDDIKLLISDLSHVHLSRSLTVETIEELIAWLDLPI